MPLHSFFTMDLLGTIALLFGIAITIIWLIIGWRAMLAHERLADAAELIARDRLKKRD